MTPFVIVTGGKGGVGKTATAANLGVHMAREGKRVLLVDFDLGLANLNVMLRIVPRLTIEDALAGSCSLAECVVTGPGGVSLLPAGSGTAAMGRPDEQRREWLLNSVAELARNYDIVIGDSGAGIGPDVLATASRADLVLVVTTPDPTALTDAYGLVKALDTFSHENDIEVPTPEVFVNMASGVEEAQSTALKLRTVCEQFLARSPRLAGWLPRASAVQQACLEQRPLVPGRERNSLENHCLRRLSRRVERLFAALCS